MNYKNKNGIEFYTYMEGRLWVTDITYDNLKFRFNNSYDYFPNYEELTIEGLKKLLKIKEEPIKEITSIESEKEIVVKTPKVTTKIVEEKKTTRKTKK